MNSRRRFLRTSILLGVPGVYLPTGLRNPFRKENISSATKLNPSHRFVAIDNVCAWPNLTVLNDGSIIATIFNQPSHGKREGDVECWASKEGQLWRKRGVPAQHKPGTSRMNVAAGMAENGDLIVLSSGWKLSSAANTEELKGVSVLRPWVSRSSDNGKSWDVKEKNFQEGEDGMTEFIPFGDILQGEDGSLRAIAYAVSEDKSFNKVSMFRSDDDGINWQVLSEISKEHNETAIYYLGDGEWIAAARRWGSGKSLDMFRSKDDGRSWKFNQPLTQSAQHPAHILRLDNGALLLSYGNRIENQYGVAIKTSIDNGITWSSEYLLIDDLNNQDVGYPSTVQLQNGDLLTAYYASGVKSHTRYHMGVSIWNFSK